MSMKLTTPLVVQPYLAACRALAWFDLHIIDGVVNLAAPLTIVRRMAVGAVRQLHRRWAGQSCRQCDACAGGTFAPTADRFDQWISLRNSCRGDAHPAGSRDPARMKERLRAERNDYGSDSSAYADHLHSAGRDGVDPALPCVAEQFVSNGSRRRLPCRSCSSRDGYTPTSIPLPRHCSSPSGIRGLTAYHIYYFLGVDGISISMVLLTAIICFISVFASFSIKSR